MSGPERRVESYTNSTVKGVAREVAETGPGGRNAALNRGAFALAQASAAGLDIREHEAKSVLYGACESNGYLRENGRKAFESTFRSGWRGGVNQPRTLPGAIREIISTGGMGPLGGKSPREWINPDSQVRERKLNYPGTEAIELWAKCLPVTEVHEVRAYVEHRGLDSESIADKDLARALPTGTALPQWARFGRRSWAESGHRLILPCWTAYTPGHLGSLVTVRARLINLDAAGISKSVAPRGYDIKRTIYANQVGMAALTCGGDWTGTLPNGSQVTPEAIIAEGEIDYLAACESYGATRPVFGIFGGSWCDAIASRFTDGYTVKIETDDDPAGAQYADKIVSSIGHRCTVHDIKRYNRG